MNRWLAAFFVASLWASNLGRPASAHTVADFLALQYQGYSAPFGFDGTEVYTDVSGAGNYAYLGSQTSGVAIIDVSIIAGDLAPSLVSVFGAGFDTSFTDIQVHDDVGYFSTSSHGTYVVDLKSPTAPQLLSQITVTPLPGDVNSDGRVDAADLNVIGLNWQASVTANESGDLLGDGFVDATDLNVLGVSWQQRVPLASVTNAIVADGFLFQVSETSADIAVIDVRDAANPNYVAHIETKDTVGIYDLSITNGRLYAAGLGGSSGDGSSGDGATYVFDVSELNRGSVPLIAEIPTGANTASASVNSDASKLIVTHREAGGTVAAWDITDPSSAFQIDEANATDFGVSSISAGSVAVLGDTAYTAYHQAGVQVLDLDLLDETDTIFRTGAFGTSQASPLDGFVGNTSVYPLDHDRVLLSDSRWGLYIVDATNVVTVAESAPVPEPSGFALMAIAGAAIAIRRHRMQRAQTSGSSIQDSSSA